MGGGETGGGGVIGVARDKNDGDDETYNQQKHKTASRKISIHKRTLL